MKKINITFEDDRAEFEQFLGKSVEEFEKVSQKLKELTYEMQEETFFATIAAVIHGYCEENGLDETQQMLTLTKVMYETQLLLDLEACDGED